MSIEGVIGGVVLLVVALVVIALPFLRERWTPISAREVMLHKAREELMTTYERILASIRDLDEDYQTGKLTEDVYQRERAYWAERGVLVLQQLEPDPAQAGGPPPDDAAASATRFDPALDDEIEQAIRAYRRAQNA